MGAIGVYVTKRLAFTGICTRQLSRLSHAPYPDRWTLRSQRLNSPGEGSRQSHTRPSCAADWTDGLQPSGAKSVQRGSVHPGCQCASAGQRRVVTTGSAGLQAVEINRRRRHAAGTELRRGSWAARGVEALSPSGQPRWLSEASHGRRETRAHRDGHSISAC